MVVSTWHAPILVIPLSHYGHCITITWYSKVAYKILSDIHYSRNRRPRVNYVGTAKFCMLSVRGDRIQFLVSTSPAIPIDLSRPCDVWGYVFVSWFLASCTCQSRDERLWFVIRRRHWKICIDVVWTRRLCFHNVTTMVAWRIQWLTLWLLLWLYDDNACRRTVWWKLWCVMMTCDLLISLCVSMCKGSPKNLASLLDGITCSFLGGGHPHRYSVVTSSWSSWCFYVVF